MSNEMMNLFGEGYLELPKKERKPKDPQKKSWENGFQKWSNKESIDGTTHYGACGFGGICDYCEDNSFGRPCVRALNLMCRDKFLSIDYSDKSKENFEKWFDGGK